MLAQFIRAQREKLHLTQENVASALEMSRPTYLQIERGARDLSLPEAVKLSGIFGISVEDLLRESAPAVSVHFSGKIASGKKSKSRTEMRISIPQQKVEKFRQVLLYILKKVGGKPNIGMTALYKLLYFIDFDYFERNEEQLMGLVYMKNHYGPTPIAFEQLIGDMVKKREVEIVKSTFYKYPQTKYLINPEIEPNLQLLNGREQEHIDWELQRLSDLTAVQLSDLSHRDVPWMSTEEGEQINYESVFYRTPETSVRKYDRDTDED